MPKPMKVLQGLTVAEEWERLFEEHMGTCETCDPAKRSAAEVPESASDVVLTEEGTRKPHLLTDLCVVGSRLKNILFTRFSHVR